MGEMINAYNILVGKPEGKTNYLQDLSTDRRQYQNGCLGSRVGRCGLDTSGSG
jgi:hypothetical protein